MRWTIWPELLGPGLSVARCVGGGQEKAERREKEEAERRGRAEEDAKKVLDARRERQARADDARRDAERRELVRTPPSALLPLSHLHFCNFFDTTDFAGKCTDRHALWCRCR